jgi:hypothetical protein
MRPIVLTIVMALAGCATTQPVEVVADSYCIASKKITWVPADTKPTIEQIVRHNARIDAACGKRKATPTS